MYFIENKIINKVGELMLYYSQKYCPKCKKWYSPMNISELNRCPKCGEKVLEDE